MLQITKQRIKLAGHCKGHPNLLCYGNKLNDITRVFTFSLQKLLLWEYQAHILAGDWNDRSTVYDHKKQYFFNPPSFLLVNFGKSLNKESQMHIGVSIQEEFTWRSIISSFQGTDTNSNLLVCVFSCPVLTPNQNQQYTSQESPSHWKLV